MKRVSVKFEDSLDAEAFVMEWLFAWSIYDICMNKYSDHITVTFSFDAAPWETLADLKSDCEAMRVHGYDWEEEEIMVEEDVPF